MIDTDECYCEVPSCPLVSLPPSSTTTRPIFELRRIATLGSEGRKSDTRAEDGGFHPAADFRFSIVDLRSASPCGGSQICYSRSETGRCPLEMLKMKQPPGMCMKTQEAMTKCPVQNKVFSRKCTNRMIVGDNRSGLLAENAEVTR